MKFRIREKKSRVEKFKDRADRAKALYFSLVVSLASIIMSCFCLLGTTYALFTSTASTENNALGAGFLSVSLHDVEIENNIATINPAEINHESQIISEPTNISTVQKLSKIVYVRNNSTIDAEYSLGFTIGSTQDVPSNEGEESILSVADFIDVSYCKVDLEDNNNMTPKDYIYLGKLSDLLLTGDETNDLSKRKAMGVLTKIKTEQDDTEELNDIQYPFYQLYEITFSLNKNSEVEQKLSELPINIVLNSTQKDHDIYQVSVTAEIFAYEDDSYQSKGFLPCTYFVNTGDYYSGKPVTISIPKRIPCLEDCTCSPKSYTLDGEEVQIDNKIESDENYYHLSINEIDKDYSYYIKYNVDAKEGK